MAKWKLTRQLFGGEEFTLTEGDKVTVGRGINNTITLSSVVISRNHCVIHVQNNNAIITDLQSSNGVYVGTNKITPNKPYVIEDSDIIGLGWTIKAPLVNICDSEKYVFKFMKEQPTPRLTNKIQFQSDNEFDDIEAEIAELNKSYRPKEKPETSPVLSSKLSLKRKIENDIKVKHENCVKSEIVNNVDVINLSDSDTEICDKPAMTEPKKPKLQTKSKGVENELQKANDVKNEKELIEYEAFSVKQEYLGYDDEPIKIDSESDSESEQWLLRLSQNSPGKPFIKMAKSIKIETKPEDGSYSQLDDDFICNNLLFEDDEEYGNDKVPEAEDESREVPDINKGVTIIPQADQEEDEFSDDIISIAKSFEPTDSSYVREEINRDEVDGFSMNHLSKESLLKSPTNESYKKAQMIEPQVHLPKGRSQRSSLSNKSKVTKHTKVEKLQSKSLNTSTNNKEERKKKLKELATKDIEKDAESSNKDSANSNKRAIIVKNTSSNRGAFLTDVAQAVVKPVKRREDANKSKDQITESTTKLSAEAKSTPESKRKDSKNSSKEKVKSNKHKDRSGAENEHFSSKKTSEQETRVPLKSLKPLADSEDSYSGKPISKVVPMPSEKQKKKVRFSHAAPQVREFEIEPGNRMKKTSLVKTTLVDIRQRPVFSLERITLMKILRWNPHWLDEQMNNNDPPPILGHNNTPMTLFHSFDSHNQYVQMVGDLLLMEIWECLTIAYMKNQNQCPSIPMKIESLPPVPTQERCFDLFNITVTVSLLPAETKHLPRVGEIMLVAFGPDNQKTQRFFFVHNTRNLTPPSQNQTRYFYSISLHATVSEKMMLLRPGEIIIGKSLAYINKELMLFEAMEYLAGSPLSNAILKPERQHFISCHPTQKLDIKSQWTKTLNPSQLKAVNSSVVAALSDKPSIQMVQGPPGTGKSSVICAIVMTYFYDPQGKKQHNRGKILICATSNAAVDGLVIKLLNLRQNLQKPERFRMVRVGRAEAMHPKAADVSSQQLALRDVTRAHEVPPTAGLNEEILHLEAKINMWKTAASEAKDASRVAFCQTKISELIRRISSLRSGSGARSGEEVRPDQIASSERRIIEGADIIVTTLASAHNHKMRGLKRRIALCIIDEAGQVIEPETLVPLTLDVTRLTLIGDPQQLPGFICSQRAKSHGLGESLFSRLTSCSDDWSGNNPVILLNQQYRMHREIADYPSRAFYGGMVQTMAPTRPDIDIPPYSIISIASGDKGQGSCMGNEMEAWGVCRLAIALDAVLRPRRMNLAIITPYNGHKELIKKHLRTLHPNGDTHMEVNTVDSFQGQERDVVIVSLARSQGVGFLTDTGRMNVMLTRAKHALFICLNPFALLKNHQWRTLVEDSQQRGLYKTLPHKMCQPINSTQLAKDDILRYVSQNEYGNRSYR